MGAEGTRMEGGECMNIFSKLKKKIDLIFFGKAEPIRPPEPVKPIPEPVPVPKPVKPKEEAR